MLLSSYLSSSCFDQVFNLDQSLLVNLTRSIPIESPLSQNPSPIYTMGNIVNIFVMLAASLVSAKVPQATDLAFAGGNSTGYTGVSARIPNILQMQATYLSQCDALFEAGLGHRVLLATNPAYEPRIQSWWAWNTRQHPWCLFQPLNASEVSIGLTALLGTGNGAGDWHVAVRSGGHSFGTSNNIDQGVTVDLGHLNQTTYDKKMKLASVGTGAKWWTVYAALQKHNVLVAGGRDGDVGVGGFTLGGGSSFFMNREGFACDGVKNYEVVLANGTIVNANKNENSDLWRALKGGGSNFGIVTRFDFETLPNKELAYGLKYMSSNYTEQLVEAAVDFTSRSHKFLDDALVVFFSHNASMASYVPAMADIGGAAIYVNTDGKQNSSAFDKLAKIPFNGVPQVANMQKKMNLTAAAYGSQLESGLWLVPYRQQHPGRRTARLTTYQESEY